MFGDEVDVGYQAYSLLNTGEDLRGRYLPFYIQSLSEYRTPLYIYSTIPFVAIFGLNEYGVRLPAAFWGIVGIIGLYLVIKKLFNTQIGLIAIFLIAISPWHLQYSRAAFEASMLLTFLIWAIYCFILGFERKYLFVLSFSIFGLVPYIYSTGMLFTPLLILILAFAFKNQILSKDFLKSSKKYIYLSIFVVFITIIPMLYSIYSGEARERFGLISIFQESVLLDKANIARKSQKYLTVNGETITTDPTIERLFHNKLTILTQVFLLNYFRALSFDFLFAEGDPNFRQSIYEMGELYGFEFITIILGIFVLISKFPLRLKILILGWLLIAPIPSSFTQGGGDHATRLILILLPLVILSSLGINYILEYKNKGPYLRGIAIFILIFGLFNVINYFHRYYVHYPVESWRFWHLGYKEALQYVSENQQNYQVVVINNTYEPALIRYLFYSKYSPNLFHQQFVSEQTTLNILPGIDGFKLGDKLIFGELNKSAKASGGFATTLKPGMLYLASADKETGDLREYQPPNINVLKTFYRPTGEPLFYALEVK